MSPALIANQSAVDAEVAAQMAEGVRERLSKAARQRFRFGHRDSNYGRCRTKQRVGENAGRSVHCNQLFSRRDRIQRKF